MPKSPGEKTQIEEQVHVGNKISIGLIALSLSLLSLALGVSLLTGPGASLLFLAAPQIPAIQADSSNSATINWTAPGDDGNVGQAQQYDVRYSSAPITDANFSAASQDATVLAPQPAGVHELHTVTGLTPSTTYYFAVKTKDEANNVSSISNISTMRTDDAPQACVPTYLCSTWSACNNGFMTRACTVTNGCPAGVDQPLTTQSCTVAPVCTPNWSCTNWSACSNNGQTRTCTDANSCGVTLNKPTESQSCTAACTPSWNCSDWSTCANNSQIRTCTDANQCGTGSQPLQQSCTVTTTPVGGPGQTSQPLLAIGVGPGTRPLIRLIDPTTKKVQKEFAAFASNNKKGVNTSIGDVNGDGQSEIVAGTGSGSNALVRVFNAQGKKLAEIKPYLTTPRTGVDVAVADVNGDGRAEILTIPENGSSQLRIFEHDVKTGRYVSLAQTFVFSRSLRGGFNVEAGDLNNDGRAEIVVTARRQSSSVAILKLQTNNTISKTSQFKTFPLTFTSGLRAAVGDVNGDGRKDIVVTPGPGYWAHVKAFSSSGRIITDFLPYNTSYRGGFDLAVTDVNRDGRDEVVTGFLSGDPQVRIFRYSGTTKKFARLQTYRVYPPSMRSGIHLSSR